MQDTEMYTEESFPTYEYLESINAPDLNREAYMRLKSLYINTPVPQQLFDIEPPFDKEPWRVYYIIIAMTYE